jgi:hypothetical protein
MNAGNWSRSPAKVLVGDGDCVLSFHRAGKAWQAVQGGRGNNRKILGEAARAQLRCKE